MNATSDTLEFYLGDAQRPFLAIKSSFQPNDDDLVNIKGKTYKVLARSFTVDHADDMWQRSIRCNVIVEKQK
jgi:hypothetical protein